MSFKLKWFLNRAFTLSGVTGLFFLGSFLLVQGQEKDILPSDHLLENLPWWTAGGKVETKSLFSVGEWGLPSKDLIFIYRPDAPVTELDKPHTQTLAVCFYEADPKKYLKSFEDEGGPIQWLKIVKDPGTGRSFLIVQRSDLKGNQVVKGFLAAHGAVKQVMEATDTQAFVNFSEGNNPLEVWCSSKAFPASKGEAEHVFAWDGSKGIFQDEKVIPENPGSWSGFSVVIATPVVVAKEQPTPTEVTQAAKPATHKSLKGWWDEPLDPAAAFAKLKTELVPQNIQKGQIATLGQQANVFFKELQKQGVKKEDFSSMRAGYYAAVASALLDKGNSKDADYYLKIALSFQSDNPDALAVKARMKP